MYIIVSLFSLWQIVVRVNTGEITSFMICSTQSNKPATWSDVTSRRQLEFTYRQRWGHFQAKIKTRQCIKIWENLVNRRKNGWYFFVLRLITLKALHVKGISVCVYKLFYKWEMFLWQIPSTLFHDFTRSQIISHVSCSVYWICLRQVNYMGQRYTHSWWELMA